MRKNRLIRKFLAVVIILSILGGRLDYSEIDARTEYLKSNHERRSEDHHIGKKLVESELAEYKDAASESTRPDGICKKIDIDQNRDAPPDGDHYGEFLGLFKVTAYTAGFESCGKLPDDPLYGITATGTRVKENHTIASDWNILPPGTKIRVEGFSCVFRVEDCGGAVRGNHVDIYMENLDEALEWGVRNRYVWLVDD